MLPKSGRLLVVVADGGHARFMERAQHPNSYRTERSFDATTVHQQSHDLGSAAPGRSFESFSSTRHAMEPRTDPHEDAKRQFLREIARQINEAATQDAFDGLVLVAPARAAHELREALSAAAASRLVEVVAKDLVQVPDHEIGAHLT